MALILGEIQSNVFERNQSSCCYDEESYLEKMIFINFFPWVDWFRNKGIEELVNSFFLESRKLFYVETRFAWKVFLSRSLNPISN